MTLALRFATVLAALACLSPVALLAQGTNAQGAAPAAAARTQGLKVTYAPIEAERKQKEGSHSYRARVLSLAVEPGETPTPMLSPGQFEAHFQAVLPLAVRDRYHWKVEGRGSFALSINGEKVLSGSLRGKPVATTEPVRLKKGDNQIELRYESALGGDGQLRLSWSGPEFAFEPIPPERLEWATDDADVAAGERLRRGHHLFLEGRCVQCHRTEEVQGVYPGGGRVSWGPDLRSVGARLHPSFFAEWLKDPRAIRPDATMPKLPMEKESDYDDLAAWLASAGQPLEEAQVDAAAAEKGAERFLELGCVACHVPPRTRVAKENLHGRMSLDHVGRKWRLAALQQFLQQPSRDWPESRMPDFRLDLEDSKALAAYLVQGASVEPAKKGDVENGRRLAVRHGCDRCHQTELPDSGRRFQELRGLHAEHGCVAGDAKAPDFGFADADRAALRAFLPEAHRAVGRRAPMDTAARLLPELRCTNCHGMDGRASAWSQVVAVMSEADPVMPEKDPTAQGLPALTWVGAKLQPGWMDRFVTGREASPRPWIHARMPGFPTHGPEVIAGLVRMHGYPAQDETQPPVDQQLAAHGGRLVQLGGGFGCVQCHGVAGKPPIQVFERQGIDFAKSRHRLRHEYFARWMLDPLRIDPDAKMPKFADAKGKTPFVDVLGGDARQQFDAIWNWFQTL